MAGTGELRMGANVATKTRAQRLQEIRDIATELDCGIGEAAAIYAVELSDERWNFISAYIRARHSGDKQTLAVFESLTNREQLKK